MIYSSMTCHDTFHHARARRGPLSPSLGKHKLEEGLRNLRSLRRTVQNIQRKIQEREKFEVGESLGSCMADERGRYLKDVPKCVSEIMGNKIYPGILAQGPGGSRWTGRTAQIEQFIEYCDYVAMQLKRGVKIEYDAMKSGRSMVLELIDQAIEIVERALSRLSATTP